MSEAKRHHYVPRVYLEEFTSEQGNLLVVEKPSGKKFLSSPVNAAVITHLNTVFNEDGSRDQKTVEEFFSSVETDYHHFLAEVRQGRIDGETIDFFVKLAIHQRMRTPRVRDQLSDLILKLDKMGALEVFKPTFSAYELALLEKARNSDKNAINQLGMSLSGHFAIATGLVLEGMGFAFLRNETDLMLHTCDNPATVSGISIKKRKPAALLPLPSNRRVLIFPISHDLMLYGDTTLKSETGLIVFQEKPTLRRATVNRINRLTALSADRYVFLPSNEVKLPPANCIKNRLDSKKQSVRVFKGPFSNLLCETVRDLRRLAF